MIVLPWRTCCTSYYITMNNYVSYRDGDLPACEEYEVRVLTDLIMHKYCSNSDFEYQGMSSSENKFYVKYIQWIDDLVKASNYNIDTFKIGFKMYGTFCVMNFQYSDRSKPTTLQETDFNFYTPQLLGTFWFNFNN